jgi:hypothetical protein
MNFNLSNGNNIPMGAAVFGRKLVQDEHGNVVLSHAFFYQGQAHIVGERVSSLYQGILLPAWKFTGGPPNTSQPAPNPLSPFAAPAGIRVTPVATPTLSPVGKTFQTRIVIDRGAVTSPVPLPIAVQAKILPPRQSVPPGIKIGLTSQSAAHLDRFKPL